MKTVYFIRIFLILFVGALTTVAQARWPLQAREAVNQFLIDHSSLQGREFSVQWTHLRVDLPVCSKSPRVMLQGRDRAWGQVFLTLRCDDARGWTRPVGIYVAVKGRYLVASHALRTGQRMTAADWQWAEGDLAKISELMVEDPDQIKDLELIRPQQAGTPLRLNDFKSMTVIKAGDQVRVTLLGRGFAVSATGQALTDAAVGGTVRVRTSEGKTLQGTAISSGSVDVLLE